MLLTLRLIHVLAGILWVGTAVFTAVFLIPSIRAIGPAGGPVMQQIAQKRKLPVYFMTAGMLTVLSGFGLYWIASAGFSNGFMRSGAGMTFGTGAVLALVAMGVGIFSAAPLAKRAGELGGAMASAGKPPTPEQKAEMERLQAKMGKASALGASLLMLAAATMAVARYIP